ncbi:VC_2705 family sodium/solute symporter [Flexibacterium corallicola]|uniref:VC_2705 family sodium/solute symporter n=1 Tax=Flexibacterium corallicola TaxID=3037259 RepID=UPI00286F870C|nr:VC_2705 family sodium/solute symporter [Pseudovibrio sp. M1P-2-3]
MITPHRVDKALHLRPKLFLVFFCLYILILLALERFGLDELSLEYLLLAPLLILYIGTGLSSGPVNRSRFFVAGHVVSAPLSGLAAAACWLSPLFFFGAAGALFMGGLQGFAFIGGLAGGFIIIALLIAPYLRKSGDLTLPSFFANRFGGNTIRILSSIILISSLLLYLIAQFYAFGFLSSRYLNLDLKTAIYLGAAAALAPCVFGGMRSVINVQSIQYIVIALALALPVTIFSIQFAEIPVPQLSYGTALTDLAELEQRWTSSPLVELPKSMVNFESSSFARFFSLTLTLILGTASFAHLLMHFTTSPNEKDSQKSVSWALFFVVVIASLVPAYVFFTKLEFYQHVIGSKIDELPSWIYLIGSHGLIDICGSAASSVDALWLACKDIEGNTGVVRPQDISVNSSAILLILPLIANTSKVIPLLLLAGLLTAAISTANSLLITISNCICEDIGRKTLLHRLPTHSQILLSRIFLVGTALFATWACFNLPANPLDLVLWAFSLAAAGFFAPLVLSIWWKSCTRTGALGGMAVGFIWSLGYILSAHFDVLPVWPSIDGTTVALASVPLSFAITTILSLLTTSSARTTQPFLDTIPVTGKDHK